MRIFAVLIHGAFSSNVQLSAESPFAQGFYTTRWVLAPSETAAGKKAFRSAKEELNKWSDLRDGLVSVRMNVEEVRSGSFWRWLRGGGRGFSFYTDP